MKIGRPKGMSAASDFTRDLMGRITNWTASDAPGIAELVETRDAQWREAMTKTLEALMADNTRTLVDLTEKMQAEVTSLLKERK